IRCHGCYSFYFFFSSRRRHTRCLSDWSSDVCSSDLRHWQGRTPSERAEFVALFADLLERTYISKIESYSGERVVYAGETPDGDRSEERRVGKECRSRW